MALPFTRPAASVSNAVTAPLTSYDATGMAEQIDDVISLISPADTPVYSMAEKPNAKNPVVSWQQDELRAPAVNAAIEGGAVTASSQSAVGILQNVTQLFDDTAEVSSSTRASEFHGAGDQLAYQEMKRGKEIKRDIERALVGHHQAKVDGDVSTARKLASLSKVIATAHQFGGGVAGVIDRDGTDTRALTEVLVLSAHQTLYTAGADPNWLLVTPVDSLKVANFAYISPVAGVAFNESTRGRMVGEGTLYNKVETYIGPFGTLSVVTDRFCSGANATIEDGSAVAAGDGLAFLLDTDSIFLPTLQPFQSLPLAKTTHADRRLVFTELSCGIRNSKACGVIGDLTIV